MDEMKVTQCGGNILYCIPLDCDVDWTLISSPALTEPQNCDVSSRHANY